MNKFFLLMILPFISFAQFGNSMDATMQSSIDDYVTTIGTALNEAGVIINKTHNNIELASKKLDDDLSDISNPKSLGHNFHIAFVDAKTTLAAKMSELEAAEERSRQLNNYLFTSFNKIFSKAIEILVNRVTTLD